MKIKKKKVSVKASSDVQFDIPLKTCVPCEPAKPECKYQAALDLICAAIESLAEVADNDDIAKDSIANLGVVMLDLKGGC